jgi:hypothetical protein
VRGWPKRPGSQGTETAAATPCASRSMRLFASLLIVRRISAGQRSRAAGGYQATGNAPSLRRSSTRRGSTRMVCACGFSWTRQL